MNKRIKWKKIKQRGNLLGRNIDSPGRAAGNLYELNEDGSLSDKVVGTMPDTYYFKGNPYNTYSALIPVGNKRNPFEYKMLDYDEDENCVNCWEYVWVAEPLKWQTEKEYLEKWEKQLNWR